MRTPHRTVFGLGAKSKWDDAQSSHCNTKDQCDPDGIALVGDAQTAAALSTAGFALGALRLANASPGEPMATGLVESFARSQPESERQAMRDRGRR